MTLVLLILVVFLVLMQAPLTISFLVLRWGMRSEQRFNQQMNDWMTLHGMKMAKFSPQDVDRLLGKKDTSEVKTDNKEKGAYL